MRLCDDCCAATKGPRAQYCDPCALERRRESNRKAAAKALAEGKCILCCKPRGEGGTRRHCQPCAARVNETNRVGTWVRVGAGLCAHCGKARGDSSSARLCPDCIVVKRDAWARSKARRRALERSAAFQARMAACRTRSA